MIDRYVEAKQLESEEIREANAGGVTLANGQRSPRRPLANSTINATLELLIGILDEAVRRKLLVVNPAREKGLRLKEQRPRGNVLEIDELEDLLAAAAEIDQKVTPKVLERGATARAHRDQGVTWKEIGRRLGVAEATAIYYTQQHERRRISARRTILACLAGSGLRNTELCRIDIGDVDFAHGTINVADAKTEAGVRKVDLSPMLRDELLAWRASLDAPMPESPFFPTRAGGRRDKDNINARVIRPAVRRANERRALRGLPPLPARVTAHTLRRTYISMMFAAGAEIPYVMAQVGHGDSKVTLEIYAQVLKRRDREQIGRAFDHLLVGGGRRRAAHHGEGCEAPGQAVQDGGATGPQSRLNRVIRAEIGPKTGPKPQNRGDARPARAPLQRRNPHVCGGSPSGASRDSNRRPPACHAGALPAEL